MNNFDNIVESIECHFKIIQSPDLEHLRITFTPVLPESHLDKYMLSLNLYPNLPIDKAKQLDELLSECVQSLWVGKVTR